MINWVVRHQWRHFFSVVFPLANGHVRVQCPIKYLFMSRLHTTYHWQDIEQASRRERKHAINTRGTRGTGNASQLLQCEERNKMSVIPTDSSGHVQPTFCVRMVTQRCPECKTSSSTLRRLNQNGAHGPSCWIENAIHVLCRAPCSHVHFDVRVATESAGTKHKT